MAIDKLRNPVEVAPLNPGTLEEQRRWSVALMRKDARRELAQRFAAIQSTLNP